MSEAVLIYKNVITGSIPPTPISLDVDADKDVISLLTCKYMYLTLNRDSYENEAKLQKEFYPNEKYLKIKSNINNEKLDLLEQELKNKKANNAAIIEEIENKRDKLTIRKYLYTANFALINPKYEVSPYLALSEIPDANIKLLDTINKMLVPKVAKSKYGKRLNEWIIERKKTEEN